MPKNYFASKAFDQFLLLPLICLNFLIQNHQSKVKVMDILHQKPHKSKRFKREIGIVTIIVSLLTVPTDVVSQLMM